MKLRIATRRSRLARTQAEWVAARLAAAGHECTFVPVSTQGDRDQNRGVSLSDADTPGLFTREVEAPLLSGDADLAVHSLKDLPLESRPGLVVAAIPPREDPRDLLILAGNSPAPDNLGSLPKGSRIATSSPRREALLRAARSDLAFVPIRGNVETRLRKLDEGLADATLLALAGLKRLDIARAGLPLPLEIFPSAPAQGALGIQAGNEAAAAAARVLDDTPTRLAVTAERKVLGALGGGCHLALGATAWRQGGTWVLSAFADIDGKVRRTVVNGVELDSVVESVIAAIR